MALLIAPDQVLAAFARFRQAGAAMAACCAENTPTMEAILAATDALAAELGLTELPVTVAATGDYHFRDQLRRYSCSSAITEGFLAFRDDLRRLARPDGPYPRAQAIAQLDHGQPDRDQALFELGIGFWGTVMYDASTLPLAENIAATRAFRQAHADHYLVEGIVDEVPESGLASAEECLTDPEQAARYQADTGVELLVVNLGTEHRALAQERRYHPELARAIAARVGPRLVLHGASSLPLARLGELPADGIIKVNVWTILEREAGAAIAADAIRHRARILPPDRLAALGVELGLPPADPADRPDLAYLTDAHRRREIFFPTVCRLVREHLEALGYRRLAGRKKAAAR